VSRGQRAAVAAGYVFCGLAALSALLGFPPGPWSYLAIVAAAALLLWAWGRTAHALAARDQVIDEQADRLERHRLLIRDQQAMLERLGQLEPHAWAIAWAELLASNERLASPAGAAPRVSRAKRGIRLWLKPHRTSPPRHQRAG
jgi:hypothetical protein